MKTIKMNVQNEQNEQKNEQLVQTHPIDGWNVLKLVNIDNKGWQICCVNAIISPKVFDTIETAETYIRENLADLLVPIITFCIDKYTTFRENNSNKN